MVRKTSRELESVALQQPLCLQAKRKGLGLPLRLLADELQPTRLGLFPHLLIFYSSHSRMLFLVPRANPSLVPEGSSFRGCLPSPSMSLPYPAFLCTPFHLTESTTMKGKSDAVTVGFIKAIWVHLVTVKMGRANSIIWGLVDVLLYNKGLSSEHTEDSPSLVGKSKDDVEQWKNNNHCQ